MTGPPRWLRLSAQLLLVAVLCEAGIECLLFVHRVRIGLQARHSRDVQWAPDDYLRGRFVPGQSDRRIGKTQVSVNSLGFRGEEPRPAAQRVVCLGDSVTFGWGSSTDRTAYPAVLGQLLAHRGADVLNAGMPRWNSCDLLDLYVTRISPMRPRIVVLMAGWDDIGYEIAPAGVKRPDTAGQIVRNTASSIFSTVHVVDTIAGRLGGQHDPEAILRLHEKRPDAIHWERIDEYERIIGSTVHLLQRDGVQPVLVTLPHFLKPNLSHAEKMTLLPHLLAWPDVSYDGWRRMATSVNGRVRKVAGDLKVPLADCESRIPAERFTDVCHLDDQGYAELAACIAPAVDTLLAPH